MYKEILVPLDGSELAEKALPHAVELARAFAGRITLLAVAEPIIVYAQTTLPGYVTPMPATVDLVENTAGYLEKVAAGLRADGLEVRTVVEEAYPADQICDYCKETKVDLIVMSTHGRSGVQRWVYGSVADRVLRCASVPVLLIRALVDQETHRY